LALPERSEAQKSPVPQTVLDKFCGENYQGKDNGITGIAFLETGNNRSICKRGFFTHLFG
jgi:hypothetical protein